MKPTPIPDDEVPKGAVRKVIAGPDGDLTGEIRPVEVLAEAVMDPEGSVFLCQSVRVELEPADLEAIARAATAGYAPVFWITFMADHLHPFSLSDFMPPPNQPGETHP